MTRLEEMREASVFPIGEKNEAYQAVFTGQSYLANLAQTPDGQMGVSNVSFEAGCRNHWHAHIGGHQILLVTGGQGFYQEEGKPARLLAAGDVVLVPEGVKHWHGANQNTWLTHLAISSGTVQWFEAVDEASYLAAHEKINREGH